MTAALCKYNGLSRCKAVSWEEQQACEYAEKSPVRHCCAYMRPDGTCTNENIPADEKEKI